MTVLSEDDIKRVISATVSELHEAQAVRFTKPSTLQGWLYVVGVLAGFVAFIYTSVIFLNDVSNHHKQPYHEGAEALVVAIEDRVTTHVDNEKKHKNEAELQLQILAETRPIKENIYKIKEDVGTIKTKLDILLDRYENNR
jgi:hypothetical protein